MTRKELIGYCRYYKGEETCPYNYSENNKEFTFWRFEKMFINQADMDNSIIEAYTFHVEDYIRRFPNEKNLLTSPDISIYTKCMALYIQDMMEKWMPYDVDMVLDY